MRDLIFVSMEDWDDIWRRNQFVCAELARRHPRMKILFVGLPRNLSHDLRHGRLAALTRRASYGAPDLPNITITHPWKLLPNSVGAGRRLNERLFRAHVSRLARQLDMREPVLWLNPHDAVHMVGRMGERAAIYDVTDDWISLSQGDRQRERTRQQDVMLCRRADAVIVCSQRLLEMKRPLSPHLHLIPNGVDAEHYRAVLDGRGPLPHVAQAWRRPVLGYTGTIHPDRVDVGLVAALARAMPEASVVLVGPNHLRESDLAPLRPHANVCLTGPVPYRQVPQYMRAFDVCITPHRMTAFTESLNPIKLWEYLAAGKPIVSTDVAGFRDYRQFVEVARTADEFISGVRRALAQPAEAQEPRRAEARRHSWQARVDLVEGVIASACRTERPGVSGARVGELVHA